MVWIGLFPFCLQEKTNTPGRAGCSSTPPPLLSHPITDISTDRSKSRILTSNKSSNFQSVDNNHRLRTSGTMAPTRLNTPARTLLARIRVFHLSHRAIQLGPRNRTVLLLYVAPMSLPVSAKGTVLDSNPRPCHWWPKVPVQLPLHHRGAV